MPSSASVTACPAASRILRRIRRDIAESSTMRILATRNLHNCIVHLFQRDDTVRQMCFDYRPGHAVNNAALFGLSENEPAVRLDGRGALLTVVPHACHH